MAAAVAAKYRWFGVPTHMKYVRLVPAGIVAFRSLMHHAIGEKLRGERKQDEAARASRIESYAQSWTPRG